MPILCHLSLPIKLTLSLSLSFLHTHSKHSFLFHNFSLSCYVSLGLKTQFRVGCNFFQHHSKISLTCLPRHINILSFPPGKCDVKHLRCVFLPLSCHLVTYGGSSFQYAASKVFIVILFHHHILLLEIPGLKCIDIIILVLFFVSIIIYINRIL